MTRPDFDRHIPPILDRIAPRDFPLVLAALKAFGHANPLRRRDRAPGPNVADADAIPPWTAADLAWAARDRGYPVVTLSDGRRLDDEASWAAMLATADARELRALHRALQGGAKREVEVP